MNVEQLETDLAAAEQAVVDAKAAAEATRQELQDQYKQRDATAVRILQCCLEISHIDSLIPPSGGVGESKGIACGGTCSFDPF